MEGTEDGVGQPANAGDHPIDEAAVEQAARERMASTLNKIMIPLQDQRDDKVGLSKK
jgi:hypothetical protein